MTPSPQAPGRDEFAALVRTVADPVRRYLHRRTDPATADDVLSETLAVLWRRRAEVPTDAPIAWTIGVARLQLANALRAARRQERVAAKIATLDPPALVAPSPSPVDDEVRDTLLRLRPADAEILRLWAWDALAPAEVATVLGITAGAAAVRLHRARGRFVAAWRKSRADGGHDPVREGTRP